MSSAIPSEITQAEFDSYVKRLFAVTDEQRRDILIEHEISPGVYEAVNQNGKVRAIYGENARAAMIRLADKKP